MPKKICEICGQEFTPKWRGTASRRRWWCYRQECEIEYGRRQLERKRKYQRDYYYRHAKAINERRKKRCSSPRGPKRWAANVHIARCGHPAPITHHFNCPQCLRNKSESYTEGFQYHYAPWEDVRQWVEENEDKIKQPEFTRWEGIPKHG